MANGYEPTVYYYNPNIFPEKEYLIRKNEITEYAKKLGVPIIDGDWNHDFWREKVKGLEDEPERGARCLQCFRVRPVSDREDRLRNGILPLHDHACLKPLEAS